MSDQWPARLRIMRESTPREVFSDIFAQGSWKGAVPSGPGSSLSATKLIRARLSETLPQLGIRTLADAPCGDGTWIFDLSKGLDLYLGFDIVPELIASNQQRGLPANHLFRVTDISVEVLPRTDAILCRDCLVHMPLGLAQETIGRFQASGSEYLIATTFTECETNIDRKLGSWRQLNLEKPPFNFPPPLHILRERAPDPSDKNNSKSLGIWRLKDIDRRPIAAMPTPLQLSRQTVFFTVAVGSHRLFALPYAYSVLLHNQDAAVEIVVDDAPGFEAEYADAIASIRELGPFHIRNADFEHRLAPYKRFLLEPETPLPYVYIGDVDILVMEEGISSAHLQNSARLGLPYSNALRASNPDRLTGLHFTKREALYPVDPKHEEEIRRLRGDEQLLLRMVRNKGLATPDYDYRPIHGVHMSINRVKDQGYYWTCHESHWRRYLTFRNDARWRYILQFMPPLYHDLLRHLDKEGARRWPGAKPSDRCQPPAFDVGFQM